jgi:DNA modification methylase
MRIVGDCREVLRDLPRGSVQCCVTSPPYWMLRSYGVGRKNGEIGLEPTIEQYVGTMVEVFGLVREVLADDGTCWINLGDSYAGTPHWGGQGGIRPAAFAQKAGAGQDSARRTIRGNGLKPKDLCGIPWRVAFALQADGWYLRSDIIWAKKNPMPESVRDRPTRAHEYLFLLTKGPRYFYDAEAVREKTTEVTRRAASFRDGGVYTAGRSFGNSAENGKDTHGDGEPSFGRNRRTVWTIATSPFPGAHFATFPPKLVEPCILAGTSEVGHCPVCSARHVRIIESESRPNAASCNGKYDGVGKHRTVSGGVSNDAREKTFLGFRPTCQCGRKPVPDVVLDPFGGSGTTAEVAQRLGREWVMIELNAKYGRLIDERVQRAA